MAIDGFCYRLKIMIFRSYVKLPEGSIGDLEKLDVSLCKFYSSAKIPFIRTKWIMQVGPPSDVCWFIKPITVTGSIINSGYEVMFSNLAFSRAHIVVEEGIVCHLLI